MVGDFKDHELLGASLHFRGITMASSLSHFTGTTMTRRTQRRAQVNGKPRHNFTVRADADSAAKKSAGPFVAPKLDPATPSPIFGGSTGGLLRKAQVNSFFLELFFSRESISRLRNFM